AIGAPAGAASAPDNSWIEPYIAMRASYLMLDVKGGQDVYAVVGGARGPLVDSEKFDVDNSDGFGIKLAAGGDMNLRSIFGHLRVEAEYGFNGGFVTPVASTGGTITFQTQNTTLFGNAYYSLNTGSRFSPYVGAGLGVSHFVSDANFSSGAFNASMTGSEYKMGWQVGAGVGIYLARGTTLDIGYRFSDLGTFVRDIDVNRLAASGGTILNSTVLINHVKMDFQAQEIYLGIRYIL
ncbi:MAG: porin family protein, partial [Proteobacteria bacterium]|nr:porin family protein [Pseudomonadota bacterium]